jgi:hypothetical protein
MGVITNTTIVDLFELQAGSWQSSPAQNPE